MHVHSAGKQAQGPGSGRNKVGREKNGKCLCEGGTREEVEWGENDVSAGDMNSPILYMSIYKCHYCQWFLFPGKYIGLQP